MKSKEIKIANNQAEVTKEDFELAKEVFKEGQGLLKEVQNIGNLYNESKQIDNENLRIKGDIVKDIGNLYNESKQIDNENLRIKGDIVKEAKKFQQTQFVLESIFSERREVINKHFEIIDRGLKEGNDEMIISGLKMVGDFVSTNPLGSFDKFKKALDNEDEVLMLDF